MVMPCEASTTEFKAIMIGKSGEVTRRRTVEMNPIAELPDEYRRMLLGAIDQAARKNAPGPDGIVGEAIRTHPEEAATIMTAIAMDLVKTGCVPEPLATAQYI